MHPRPNGVVTLLTDFGRGDCYVGVMKGVVLRHCRKATLVDLGHDVPAQDVAAAAFCWWGAVGHFPPGTVHVGVVDPGVGTGRRLLAAAAHGCYWIAPDNGLLTHVLAGDPVAEVRVLDLDHLGLLPASRTFHGRDLLAPVAGWLASGHYGFVTLGPLTPAPVALPPLLGGPPRVVHVDAFGNLITSVPAHELAGVVAVRVAGVEVPLGGTYGEMPPGALLALVGSCGLLEVAENGGNAARTLGVGRGGPIELRHRKDPDR